MAEFSEAPIETPSSQEKFTVKQRFKNWGGRIMQFVKKPNHNYQLQEQAFKPAADAEADKKINPKRAEHISLQCCGVRAIMSAAAFASGESNISATTSDTAPEGEEGEWDMRIKQIKEGSKPIDQLSQDLMDLYADYAKHNTPLGNALKRVEVTHHKTPESEYMIKKRILAGEQVMVFTPSSDPNESHIFHVGLDKRGRIISLSDEKRNKRSYQRMDLSHGTFIAFSVLPKGTTPITFSNERQTLALAA